MASLNGGMHGSEILRDEIFQNTPKSLELQARIDAMLLQFSPKKENSPKVQEALNRIGSISEKLTSLAGETRAEIVSLYVETVTKTHLSDCASKVAILEAHQSTRIANILGASNDAKFSQAA